ncbi:MAG: hypothetical protein ACSHX3_05775 [Litorimonas sp.]
MTNDTLMQDLADASRIAREGETTPLLGGPVGLMWASLTTIALITHGAVLAGWIDIPVSMTGLIWVTQGVLGTILTVILSRRLSTKPGCHSFANRAAEGAWVSGAIMIATFAISLVVASFMGRTEVVDFNFIVPAAFAISAVINGLLARLTGYGYLKFGAIMSGVATTVTLIMVRQPEMYFVAGALLIVSGVIPSLIENRRAH